MPRANREILETCENCRFRVGKYCRRNPPQWVDKQGAWDYPQVVFEFYQCEYGKVTSMLFEKGCFAGEVSE